MTAEFCAADFLVSHAYSALCNFPAQVCPDPQISAKIAAKVLLSGVARWALSALPETKRFIKGSEGSTPSPQRSLYRTEIPIFEMNKGYFSPLHAPKSHFVGRLSTRLPTTPAPPVANEVADRSSTHDTVEATIPRPPSVQQGLGLYRWDMSSYWDVLAGAMFPPPPYRSQDTLPQYTANEEPRQSRWSFRNFMDLRTRIRCFLRQGRGHGHLSSSTFRKQQLPASHGAVVFKAKQTTSVRQWRYAGSEAQQKAWNKIQLQETEQHMKANFRGLPIGIKNLKLRRKGNSERLLLFSTMNGPSCGKHIPRVFLD
ncbi:hypothetical protein BDZ97DRAFT_1755064 [Flammula alnicola]|nr:hypothetical protein BDZ97DRAFT_1755064 [Flammula alnicola]